MKYKRYILKFTGDPEVVAFLAAHIREQQPDLARARLLGKAARTLLGVEYEVVSVTLPRPSAEKVKTL